jgi:hypothetical protein
LGAGKARHLLSEDSLSETRAGSMGCSGDVFWKETWKLNVPPKVRVFWWRVLHEFLPAKSVLYRRHIEPTAFCEVCELTVSQFGMFSLSAP